jgi:hypothetical protein
VKSLGFDYFWWRESGLGELSSGSSPDSLFFGEILVEMSYFFGLNGDIKMFPIISKTGRHFKIKRIMKIKIANFQFKKINPRKRAQSIQKMNLTQSGRSGSSTESVPFRFA